MAEIPTGSVSSTISCFILMHLQVLLIPIWPLLLVYLVYYTNYGILSLLYLAWMICDTRAINRGGRRFNCVRNFRIFKYLAQYFPIRLVKTADLDANKNYLFCLHPHGIFATGGIVNFGSEATNFGIKFPGIRPYLLTVENHFRIPFHRESLIYFFGFVTSTKESLQYLLNKPTGGNAAVLYAGGPHEMLDAHPNTYILNLSKRMGFIKIALQNGASLVPVFTFGETDTFRQVKNPQGSFLRTIQNYVVNKTGIPLVTPLNLIPKRQRLVTVVGAPLEFNRILEPTTDQIEAFHKQYVEALKALFYSHRDEFGESSREITIV